MWIFKLLFRVQEVRIRERNALYCASFKQSLKKFSNYYKHTQTVPIWQRLVCLSWCALLGLPVAQMTSCLMLRTGQQQSTQSYHWNLQGGKNRIQCEIFSAKLVLQLHKKSFIQCKCIYNRELAYLILIQCIYKRVKRVIFIQCVYK